MDSPNTRDLQFLITDGESFCHEERRDLLHKTEYPEQNALFYRLTNSDREGRYRLVKEIVVDPHSSVLLMHTRLEILDPKLRGKLRLYALLAPHMKGTGKNNSARLCGLGGRKLIEVQREDIDMSFGCAPDFTRRSVGYVGFSDGWQDLMDNFKMDWEFDEAVDGNIALIGERLIYRTECSSRWAWASGALRTALAPTSCKRSPPLSPTSARSMSANGSALVPRLI